MSFPNISAIIPVIRLADPGHNVKEMIRLAVQAGAEGAGTIVFPSHSITGATCGDLLGSRTLRAAEKAARKELEMFADGAGLRIILESRFLEDCNTQVICAADSERTGRYEALCSDLKERSAKEGIDILYVNAGFGESTTDNVYSGGALLFSKGRLVASAPRFRTTSTLMRSSSSADLYPEEQEAMLIQSFGLIGRMKAIGCEKAVIGISGGLDSTLALLSTVHAFDLMGTDRKNIIAITMPGFGTSGRTHVNANELMETMGVSSREISISASVNLHFKDIGHNPDTHNSTYENAQARERTQILMDIAGECGGIVIGTGDLSEDALGWCTFNGDHMAMYNLNAGISKTDIRKIVGWAAGNMFREAERTLLDILETPISPELVKGQVTEDTVGPYELHDFFIGQLIGEDRTPSETLEAAMEKFGGKYDRDTVKKWMRTFIKRFFASQFKRNCCPDGPQIGKIGFSPRGAWKMPSDASPAAWLNDLEKA